MKRKLLSALFLVCSCFICLIWHSIAIAEKSFAQSIDDISGAGSYVYIYNQGDRNLYSSYPSYNLKYINGSYTDSGVPYHNNLGHGGCGIYTYAHAIQWLTSDYNTESAAISLLDTLIAIDPEPYSTLEPLDNYIQTLGITKVSRPTTESAIVQHFQSGGVVILHPFTAADDGHYCLAIGAAYGNIDGAGNRLWIHVLDSSVSSTTKRIGNYSAYGFVSPHSRVTNDCYFGADYWIPVEAYLYGFTATSDMKAYLPKGNVEGNFHYSIEACVGDGGVVFLKGWVYNSNNVTRSIQIHAYLDGGPGSGASSWAIPADVARTDIDEIYHIGAYHGFEYNIKGVSQGQHTLQLFANDQYLNESMKIGDYQVTISSDSFVTVVEECRGATNAIYLRGWVHNNNNITNSIQVHVYLDGPLGSSTQSWAVPANVSRKDLDAIYKAGEFHGFDYYVTDIQPGNHTVYLYVNDQFRHTHEEMGHYNIVVEDNIPTPMSLTVTPTDSLLSLLSIDNKEDLEAQTAYYSGHIREHLTVEVNYSDGSKQAINDYDVETWVEHSDDKPLVYGYDFRVTYGDLKDTSEISITIKPTPTPTPTPTPVYGEPDFTLPTAISTVDESAFEGIAATIVYLPDICTSIGKWAFKDCEKLTQIRIPANCVIGSDAFSGCVDVVIFGTKGSAAEAYANSHANCTFVAE